MTFPDSKPSKVRFYDHRYVHVSSKGEATQVYVGVGGDRWYYEETGVNGRRARMMLPALPNRTHGRYFAELFANTELMSPRRAYRALHDDWMLP